MRLSDGSNGGVIDNTNGAIHAEDGTTVQFLGGMVNGGTLSSIGTGKFEVVNGQQGTLAGSVNNEALIEIGGVNSSTILNFAPNAVIDGPGEIEMLSTSRSRMTTAGANDMFTNGASHLIHGNGRIGNGNMLNLGTIAADNSSLRLNPANFVNQGTVEATAGVLIIDNNYSGVPEPSSAWVLAVATLSLSRGCQDKDGEAAIDLRKRRTGQGHPDRNPGRRSRTETESNLLRPAYLSSIGSSRFVPILVTIPTKNRDVNAPPG